ncbi:MAG: DNA-binding GntR family transcriptional regulator [Cocleimonas sp.]|jgi:DNA-binding GntR family transcriptional regulator
MTRSADKLISQITQDISSGSLRPGDQLEETELADRFQVSRTPIREAIRVMVSSGLLETRPRKGAFVRVLTPEELLDLFEVSAELEGMACRLAAGSLTEEHAKAIMDQLEKCKAAAASNDRKLYSICNLDFHSAIHRASRNKWLISQLKQIGIHLNAYRSIPYDMRGRLAKSAEEHIEIYEAIFDGDERKANDLMRDHMMLQGKRLPSMIKFMAQNNQEKLEKSVP